MHGVPHAARLGALPAAVELVELRLPRAVPARCGRRRDARFEIAKVERSRPATRVRHRPRRPHRAADRRRARLAPRARPRRQRPAARGARSRRGLEVHPHGGGDRPRRLDRPLASSATATPGRCPRPASSASASAPTSRAHHVKEPTKDIARAARARRRPLPGQLVPARAAPGGRGRRVLRRRQRRATASRSRARGSAPRSTSGSPPAASCAPCSTASATREQALAALRRVLAPATPAPSGCALRAPAR